MTMAALNPVQALDLVTPHLKGLPACIAGSTVAAMIYDLPLADTADLDVFCYSSTAMIAGAQKLQACGFTLNPRFERVWERWLCYGFNRWHTNSIKFDGPEGIEVNVVHKLQGGHPTSSLAQVLESFDFGLLAAGYDLSDNMFKDMRSYLFPQHNIYGPLPLMPAKRDAWRAGFISQYNGIREVGRYAKYAGYGHDMSKVKDDLIEGYLAAALYHRDRDSDEHQQLGQIYDTIASKMMLDDFDDLNEAGQKILYLDSLDLIMEALE